MAPPPSALPLHLLHLVALQSLAQEGFNSSSLSASHALTDVLAHFLSLLASTAGSYADASGRTHAGLMDGVRALDELGLSVDELLEAGRVDALDEDELGPPLIQEGPSKARGGLEGLRSYLEDGLETPDSSDRQVYVYGSPSAEQIEAHLAYERANDPAYSDSDSDSDEAEDEVGVRPAVVKLEPAGSEDEGIEPDGGDGSANEDRPPIPSQREQRSPSPLSLAALEAEVAAEEEEGREEATSGLERRPLPFGRRMAHLPALPAPPTAMSIAAARLPRLGTPLLGAALNGPGTPSRAETPALLPGRASVEPSFVGDQPSFLRSTPYARSSLAESSSSSSGGAGLSFPSGPDGQTVHSAPTMAHSATLPALISAYSALNRAIIVDPQSALAGGQPPVGGKNAKRLRAAYHLSFQSAPPEAYSPSPSLFASIAVPSARTTGLVPQVPPISSGVVLPPEVARARSRAVVAGLPTTALAPGGAHRHPNMLANVLHYIAPPGLLLRASRMAEPGPLIEKGKELYYGPVYDSKGVIVTTTGGGIIRHRLPPVKPVGGTHPKGPKGKGKGKGHKKKGGRDSDDEFEALLLDGPPPEDDDDDDGFLVVGNGYGAGDLGDGEWEEEEEELVVEVKEVDVELRATWDAPVRSFKDDELPFERKRRRVA